MEVVTSKDKNNITYKVAVVQNKLNSLRLVGLPVLEAFLRSIEKYPLNTRLNILDQILNCLGDNRVYHSGDCRISICELPQEEAKSWKYSAILVVETPEMGKQKVVGRAYNGFIVNPNDLAGEFTESLVGYSPLAFYRKVAENGEENTEVEIYLCSEVPANKEGNGIRMYTVDPRSNKRILRVPVIHYNNIPKHTTKETKTGDIEIYVRL